jgi:hypothetical protein
MCETWTKNFENKRVEVRLFVLSLEIEYRDAAEVATGRSTKRPSTLMAYSHIILRSSGSQKENRT